MVFGISIFLFMFLFNCISYVSAIRINEIELNPTGTDSGNEWLELYSEKEVSLSGWKLVNNDGKEINLSQSFQGYLIINFSGQWLDNSDEKIILKDNNSNIAHETIILDDSYGDDRTWQYCNGNWKMADGTRNSANSCTSQNQSQNQSQNTTQNFPQNLSDAKLSLDLEWEEDEVINGEEFEVDIKANNLGNGNYDIKVYISQEDDGTIISETYDKKENEWKSSSYYVNDILSGTENKSKSFELRIREKYRNFSGDAKIGVKIKKSGTSSITEEIEKDIEILEKEEKLETEENNQEKQENSEVKITEAKETKSISAKQTGSVIRLGNRNKTQEESGNENKEENSKNSKILYESSSEKIKKYAIYGLNLILIVIIFLLISFKKEKKLRNAEKNEK